MFSSSFFFVFFDEINFRSRLFKDLKDEKKSNFRFEIWTSFYLISGSGCSTAAERTLHKREIVGSIPAGCWALYPR